MKRLITLLIFWSIPLMGLMAQITTSAISGKVTSTTKEDLIGVVVQAIHVPTGTKYLTTTDLNGLFVLSNLQSGGPYKIVATYIGYNEKVEEGLYLELGNTTRIHLTMAETTSQLEEVTITSDREADKVGAGTQISKEQLKTLPTLSRSFTDMTRLTPQASNNSFNGVSWRYNNISVDGAVNNDAIGFSPSLGGVSGTANMPGSSTRTNSISLDAIDQLQVQISPFDVKYGNFTGGAINAVTRRGTNEVTGSVYAFGRSAAITGPNNSGDKSAMPNSYYDYQIGARVGLPIVKDKLFLFTNIETTNRQEPLFNGAGQNGGLIADSTANHIAQVLQSQSGQVTIGTGTNAGVFNGWNGGDPSLGVGNQNFNIYSKSVKVFARFDWNINDRHQLTYRINYIPSQASYLDRSALEYRFADNAFVQKNDQVSNVLELKSRWNKKMSGQLILGYTSIHDYRDPTGLGSSITPQIQISGVNGGNIFIGTDRESAAFNQYSRTTELTYNLNYYWRKHNFTLGTHNELYGITYGFINSYNGRIDYNGLSNFYNNKMSRFRSFYNLQDNSHDYVYNNPSAQFNIFLWSAYLQDEIQLTDRIKITPGIRIDLPVLPTGPSLSGLSSDPNQNLSPNGNEFNFSSSNNYNNQILGKPVISPRLGFNIDVLGNKKVIIRGGTGTFMGRIPFAWFGYAYYNNGVSFGSIDYKPSSATNVPIASDPTQFGATANNPTASSGNFLNTALGAGNRREVDFIDPNFKMPYMWRSNLAADITLPSDYKLTLEGIYTKTLQDVMIQNLIINQNPATTYYYSYDTQQQQPIFGGGSLGGTTASSGFNGGKNNYSNIYLLTNTNQGYRYSLTAQLRKTYKFGLDWSAAYTNGQSFDVLNGVRNSMESGWQTNQALNPNNPSLSVSNFNINHIIVATLGYKKDWNPKHSTYVSAVLTMQSGSPYTYGMTSTINNSGTQADLAYIPTMDNSNGCVAINPSTNRPEIIFSDQLTNNVYDPAKYASPMSKAFYNYVNNSDYLKTREGNFTQRNGAQTPWNNRLDVRIMHDFNFYAKQSAATVDVGAPVKEGKKHTIQVSWDIINFTNLLNPQWGWNYFVPNTINSTVDIGLVKTGVVDNKGTVSSANATTIGNSGSNPGNNSVSTYTPVYNYTGGGSYTWDQLGSRWQMQVGVRYLF